ncbi:unnamed protein product [Schistosoma mattheei]|uniref:Uncharacterized protein n=1 Tax=Schistosoma mattheei TaxID=31246 RepID=A0A183NM68_9TREM|nr:unnamed protein product [Schistosoma mattheei]
MKGKHDRYQHNKNSYSVIKHIYTHLINKLTTPVTIGDATLVPDNTRHFPSRLELITPVEKVTISGFTRP